MSRYRIPSSNPSLEIIVGWDGPMETFFGQVFDPRLPEEEECVVWVGTTAHALMTIEALQAQMADYASLPVEIQVRLAQDQRETLPPTLLQLKMRQVLEELMPKENA